MRKESSIVDWKCASCGHDGTVVSSEGDDTDKIVSFAHWYANRYNRRWRQDCNGVSLEWWARARVAQMEQSSA